MPLTWVPFSCPLPLPEHWVFSSRGGPPGWRGTQPVDPLSASLGRVPRRFEPEGPSPRVQAPSSSPAFYCVSSPMSPSSWLTPENQWRGVGEPQQRHERPVALRTERRRLWTLGFGLGSGSAPLSASTLALCSAEVGAVGMEGDLRWHCPQSSMRRIWSLWPPRGPEPPPWSSSVCLSPQPPMKRPPSSQ